MLLLYISSILAPRFDIVSAKNGPPNFETLAALYVNPPKFRAPLVETNYPPKVCQKLGAPVADSISSVMITTRNMDSLSGACLSNKSEKY